MVTEVTIGARNNFSSNLQRHKLATGTKKHSFFSLKICKIANKKARLESTFYKKTRIEQQDEIFKRNNFFLEMAASSQPSLNCNSTSSYFQSISLSSTANQLNGLASDLSDLAIGDRPPPRKIRRRNALTVQDPHYPLIVPPPNSPVHDPFEDSSRLQALDEIVHRDFSLSEEPSAMCSSEPKRKLASNRQNPSIGPRLPGVTLNFDDSLSLLLCSIFFI